MAADLGRAEALLELDRFREAEEIIRARLTEEPESADALRLLAEALLGQHRDADALQAAQAAVSADPADEHAHRLLSITLQRADRTDESVHAAQQAVLLAPYLWQTHYTLGMALRSGRRPRSRDALACANEAVRLAPHESHPHNLAGLCLDDLRLEAEATKAYAEALRLDPTNATAMNNLAASRLNDGQLVDATRLLTSGLSISPQTKILHRNYDALLMRLVRRLYFALLGLGAVLAVLAGAGAPYAARVATVVVLLGVYAYLTRQVTRQLPRGAHLWVRGLFRRCGWGERVAISVLILVSLGVLVIGLAPRDIALGSGLVILRMLQVCGFRVIVVGLFNLVTGRSRRRPD